MLHALRIRSPIVVGLVTFGAIIVSSLVVATFKAYVLASCSGKLGCYGDVMFFAYIAALVGPVSAVTSATIRVLLPFAGVGPNFRFEIYGSLVAGIVLGIASSTIIYWPFPLVGLIAAWFGLSVVVVGLSLWMSV